MMVRVIIEEEEAFRSALLGTLLAAPSKETGLSGRQVLLVPVMGNLAPLIEWIENRCTRTREHREGVRQIPRDWVSAGGDGEEYSRNRTPDVKGG